MADVATFREIFPEFALTKATDAQIGFWLTTGSNSLSAARLGANNDLAVMLFAAHNLTLAGADQAASLDGDAPGSPNAPVSSQGAGGLSVSFATEMTLSEGAGIYNATSYGQRLWALLKAASLGGFFRNPNNQQTVPVLGPFFLRQW